MVTRDPIVVAIQEQVFSKLSDEIVILSLNDGIYYGLNSVGARIWELIQTPRSIKELCDQLVQEYNVEADQCERETLALLNDLQKHHLVEVHESGSPVSVVSP